MANESDRFFSKVDKTDTCWLWKAGKDWDGYGIFHLPASLRRGRTVRATRYAWELAHGCPPPAGAMVCHRCDTPACVNPAHLFIGTARDNFHDCLAKGRYSPKGSGNAAAKLTEADIPKIRALYGSGAWSQQAIADIYGVRQNTIGRIVRRQKWAHVPDNDTLQRLTENTNAA